MFDAWARSKQNAFNAASLKTEAQSLPGNLLES
jgi:hypothetical protein